MVSMLGTLDGEMTAMVSPSLTAGGMTTGCCAASSMWCNRSIVHANILLIVSSVVWFRGQSYEKRRKMIVILRIFCIFARKYDYEDVDFNGEV